MISSGCRWRKVDVGDELLTGASEGGFIELEELDAGDAAFFDVAQHTLETAHPARDTAPKGASDKKAGKHLSKRKLGGERKDKRLLTELSAEEPPGSPGSFCS